MAVSTIKGRNVGVCSSASGKTAVSNRLVKDGSAVSIALEVSGTFTSNAYNTIATLPDGYKPSTTIVKAFVPTTGMTGYLRILTNGTIDVLPAGNTDRVYVNEVILT